MAARLALVTGASSGIGAAFARIYAAHGYDLAITARRADRLNALADEVRLRHGVEVLVVPADLADAAAPAAVLAEVAAHGRVVDALINNAGLAGQRGLTASGFELAFGTNHIGPFLLPRLLLDRLRASAPARIVTVSSEAHYRASGIDWEAVRTPTATRTGWPEYGVSKLANVLHAQELGRRLAGSGVTTYALHPGMIASDVWRRVPWPIRPLIKLRMSSVETGARTPVYCTTSPDVAGDSGLYYEDCRLKPAAAAATPELAAELWTRSDAWLGGSA